MMLKQITFEIKYICNYILNERNILCEFKRATLHDPNRLEVGRYIS